MRVGNAVRVRVLDAIAVQRAAATRARHGQARLRVDIKTLNSWLTPNRAIQAGRGQNQWKRAVVSVCGTHPGGRGRRVDGRRRGRGRGRGGRGGGQARLAHEGGGAVLEAARAQVLGHQLQQLALVVADPRLRHHVRLHERYRSLTNCSN